MTGDEFSERYALRTRLAGDSVESWLAVRRDDGRAVMAHRLAAPVRAGVLEMTQHLGTSHRVLILELLTVDEAAVIVTEDLSPFTTFIEWLQTGIPANVPAIIHSFHRRSGKSTAQDAMIAEVSPPTSPAPGPPIGPPPQQGIEPSLTQVFTARPASLDAPREGIRTIDVPASASDVFRMSVAARAADDGMEQGPEFREGFMHGQEARGSGNPAWPTPAPPGLLAAVEGPSPYSMIVKPKRAPAGSATPNVIPRPPEKRRPSPLVAFLLVIGLSLVSLVLAVLVVALLLTKR